MKGFGGMGQLMKQANQMQMKMKKLQEELALRVYEGSAGGGGVTVKVDGNYQLQDVSIQKDLLQSGDADMIQDLVKLAANEALKTAKETSSQEMGKITGGLNLPGMS